MLPKRFLALALKLYLAREREARNIWNVPPANSEKKKKMKRREAAVGEDGVASDRLRS